MAAGIPDTGPAARQARTETAAQPPGSLARSCSSGFGVGPLFVLISLAGLARVNTGGRQHGDWGWNARTGPGRGGRSCSAQQP